jgi:ABC-type multidrug transport system permease subunit
MDNETQKVVVTDIKMPFFSMVVFMIKWMLASIPAFIVIAIIVAVLSMGIGMVINMLELEPMLGELMQQLPQLPQ